MGGLFQEYETQFINLLSLIRQGKEGGLEQQLTQAEELLWKMSMEARALPSPAKEERSDVVRQHRSRLKAIEDALRARLSHASTDKDARTALGLGSSSAVASPGQRDRLLKSTATLEKSGNRMHQSQQLVADMEAQGASILEQLHGQRQTIQRASGRLQDANDAISTSQKILKSMGRWLPF